VEQYVTFPAGGLTLEGVFHRPETGSSFPAVAVCHPHPLYGGEMHNSVVVAICEELASAGMGALRFNFRGSGASQGSFGGGIEERDDVQAALDYLEGAHGVDGGRMGLAGYSFGALVALTAVDERVRGVAAVSPPLAMQNLSEWELRCPALFVFGADDVIAPAERLEDIVPSLKGEYQKVIVPGADHFWWGREKVVAKKITAFFQGIWSSGEEQHAD
jgi:alpha/beta superfamily hydrolase